MSKNDNNQLININDAPPTLEDTQIQQSNKFTFIALGASSRNNINPDDVINSYPNINIIRNGMNNLESLNYEELINIKDKLYELQEYYMEKMSLRSYFYLYNKKPFEKDIINVNDYIDSCDQLYNQKLEIFESEEINGYKLYNTKVNVMSYDFFKELIILWNKDVEYTYDEFYEKYDSMACSDWSKQDRHGESFGGFWTYPDGTYEKNNAYNLSRDDNCKGLWELPYPKEIILKTIEMGCSNRMESVRYSNFLCEWIKRKMLQLNL
jgi:hypothetical protein